MSITAKKVQPPVLTVAGSDPSGGAGIQADLKTFAAHGCYGASVLTALTAQNTTGVQNVFPVPPSFVEEQIQAVLDDIDVRAVKTGMLYDAENTRAVVRSLNRPNSSSTSDKRQAHLPLVCDPVCVSTSGHTLLHADAVEVLVSELFPISTLITPNKSEAELLLRYSADKENEDIEINSLDAMLVASRYLLAMGPRAVLLKGGHVTATIEDLERFEKRNENVHVVRDGLYGENMEILQVGGAESPSTQRVVVDVLREGSKTTVFARPHIETKNTHGTGCTLSAAIASNLAHGQCMADAVRAASVYTHLGIEGAPDIGHGNGPLNHLHSINPSVLPQQTQSNRYPLTKFLIEDSSAVWKQYVEHEFVRKLGQGELSRESFVYFLKQDYIYLRYYARAYGLLASKSNSYPEIASATQVILNVLEETKTHKKLCAKFGVTDIELESAEEGLATAAYGGYLLNTGLEGDATKLLMALLACLLGYGEVGLWLKKQANSEGSSVRVEGNPYRVWIEDYSGELYQNAVRIGLETIESRATIDPPSASRLKEWSVVWKRCTEFEKGFWDAAMCLGR